MSSSSESTKLNIEAFDKEMKSLIKQLEETIKSKYGNNASNRSEFECLNRYSSIYKNTKAEEHIEYFQKLYEKRRVDILNTLKDDKWLRTGNIIIQFGEGTEVPKDIENRRKKIKLLISDIYKMAVDLQTAAEKTMDGIDNRLADESIGKD